jgi:hypothetical protein
MLPQNKVTSLMNLQHQFMQKFSNRSDELKKLFRNNEMRLRLRHPVNLSTLLCVTWVAIERKNYEPE